MIFKSRSEKTFEEADAILDTLTSRYQEEMDAGTLTEEDRERIRPELKRVADLMTRAEGGEYLYPTRPGVRMVKRFFREGRFSASDEERMALLLKLKRDAEALLERASPPE